MEQKLRDLYHKMTLHENGLLSRTDTVKLFSELISKGMIPYLRQDKYYTYANAIVNLGYLKPDGSINKEN